MMTLRNHLHSAILGWGMAIGLIGLPAVATAQQVPEQGQNPDLTRQQVATFDQFLDSHPQIAQQLQANPSLVNNAEFLEGHPQLQAFLTSHPELSEELKENPAFFMQRERQFEKAENRRPNPNPDLTRQQVATFDQFLDSHPQIAQQLQANPSLINNAEFLEGQPQLQAFLTSHPELSEELKENPAFFMQRERQFEKAENRRPNPNPDLTRQQVATFDQFLDSHPPIAQQLQANPSLVNNAEFLEGHPQLQAFLTSHPELSEELKENPAFFMQRERQFEKAENRRPNPNPDLTRQQVATFDQFLDSHPQIAQQLQANPSLINNAEFLEGHPQLQAFLTSHPELSEELKENPAFFMQRERQFEKAENRRPNPNPDLTRQQVATFDQFLDSHPQIAQQLQANPSLVNNAEFLEGHPQLQTFLTSHPELREELRENPSFLMRQENRFETAENRMPNPNSTVQNPDLTERQLATFDRFLDHHKDVAKDLEKNPNLVNDRKFLHKHKDLRSFLKHHPEVGTELRENPPLFMQKEARFERRDAMRDRDDHRKKKDDHGRRAKNKDKDKHKSKLEQRESLMSNHPH